MTADGDSTRVTVSTAALRANLDTLTSDDVVDLRRDAYGHGLETVWELASAAGARHFVTDVDDSVPGGSASARATVTAARVYGLPGSSTTPAMTVTGTVLLTKELLAGEGVSYGFRYRAAADTRVALVTGGYGQGIVRSLGGRVGVTVGEARLPIVGRVAMDVCVIEIGDEDVVSGATVTFVGDPASGAPSLADWASATGLTAEELVAVLGERGTREYTA